MNDSNKSTLVDVLLIEDNIVDVRLLEEAVPIRTTGCQSSFGFRW